MLKVLDYSKEPKITTPDGRIFPDGFMLSDNETAQSAGIWYAWDWALGGWLNHQDSKVYNFEYQRGLLCKFAGPYPHLNPSNHPSNQAPTQTSSSPPKILYPDGTEGWPVDNSEHISYDGTRLYEWRQGRAGWILTGLRSSPAGSWNLFQARSGPYYFKKDANNNICRYWGRVHEAVVYLLGLPIANDNGHDKSACKRVEVGGNIGEESSKREMAFFCPPRTCECECGAWAARSTNHSSWCKMFKEKKD